MTYTEQNIYSADSEPKVWNLDEAQMNNFLASGENKSETSPHK